MYRSVLCALSLLLGLLSSPCLGQSKSASLSYLKLPLSFEANQGQADGQARFLSRGAGYALYLGSDGAVLKLAGERQALSMRLVGANRQARIEGLQRLPGKSHYFLGNDPARWVTNVAQYGEVRYAQAYAGIDLVYHGDHESGGRLEYDFVVAPGADPSQIELDITALDSNAPGSELGTGELRTIRGNSGDILMRVGHSQIRNLRPRVYQDVDGQRREVTGHYVVTGGHRVRFALGDYDHSRTLVIDPVILYATTLGNTATTEPCQPCIATAVDSAGNLYVAGSTTDTNFPTQSPMQGASGGQKDVFITKINAAGTALIYSTYLGGSGSEEAHGLALDSSNNAYVTGYTSSSNFPLQSPIQGALSPRAINAFVAKLNAAGSALVYSTYLGGSMIDNANAIAVDSTGAAYVAGYTYSSNFPTVAALQPTLLSSSGTNAFLTKINPAGTALVYSTYLGGSGADAAYGVAVDSSFNAYVAGGTSSKNFPTANALQNANAGAAQQTDDAFVAKVNAAGSALVFSTYYGGTGQDDAYAIALDSSQNVYVAGYTNSLSTFPTFNPLPAPSGGQGGFLIKLNAGGQSLAYATTLDSNGKGLAVDSYGNAYLTGRGADTGANAVSIALRVNAAGNGLDYSFQLGQALTDVAQAIALDASGNVYVAGQGKIDTTTTPPQSANNSATTVSVAKIGQSSGPYIGVLTPSFATSGGSSATLRVIGTGFLAGASVLVNGNARSTTVVSATEVDGVLTAGDLASPGTLGITVANTSGNPSNNAAFAVTNVPPSITGFSPASVAAGGPAFTLTINGAGFTSGSVVFWNGLARSTTFVSAAQVTAQILSTDITAGGMAAVQVNAPAPGGGLSAASAYSVNNPVPSLATLLPTSINAQNAGTTLTVQGSSFAATSIVLWNNSPRATTFVSSTQLQAAILAADLLTAGAASVQVQTPTPGGGVSSGLTFAVTGNSVPQVVTLSPTSVIAGGSAFTLTVTGSGFVASSQVLWNGSPRATGFTSATQLTITVSAADIASIGSASVAVSSPSPGGGTSSALTFAINGNPAPTTSSISPTSATAGGAGFTLTVNGTAFVNGSSVYWNGVSRASTILSATQITTQITAQDIADGGTPTVQVFVPTPGGGLSSPALTFTVNNPLPSIGSLTPNTLPVGGSNFSLTVTGSGFTPSSQVQWNGSARSTTFASSTQLTATINASDLATAGTASVAVFNRAPAGGTSGGVGFTIASNPTPTVTSISPSVLGAGTGNFTLTVTGSGFLPSLNSQVQWNGSNRATTYVSATTLTAAISAADVSGVGTATVQVFNQPPGGGVSNTQVFTISSGCTYLLTPSATSFPPTSSTGSVAVAAPTGCNWSATTTDSFITITSGASGTGAGTVSFTVAANTTSGRSGTLTIAGQQVSITQGSSIQGTIAPATSLSGAANGVVRVPVSMTLNSGTSADGISFTLQVTPNSAAPAIAATLGFTADAALPGASVNISGGAGTIAVSWTGLSPLLTGAVHLGDVLVTVPSGAQAGQAYTVQITAAGGTFQTNGVPLAGASGTLTVVLDYLVGDPFPNTSDSVGGFGDNVINTLDLIATLRAATGLTGFVPATCSDRFDAMDASPVDTATTRGGDGVINTLDLIVILKRATNLDTTRPRRLSRGLSCPASAPEAAPQATAARFVEPREAAGSLELVSTADGGVDVYLQAFRDIHLSGLAIALGSADASAILSWTDGEGAAPSVVDSSLADRIAIAWLSPLDLVAGGRARLGHVRPDKPGVSIAIQGASANDQASGKDVRLMVAGDVRVR
jgi:hypothetical protein